MNDQVSLDIVFLFLFLIGIMSETPKKSELSRLLFLGKKNEALQIMRDTSVHDPSVLLRDRHGFAPIHYAIMNTPVHVVKMLVEKWPQCINTEDDLGMTPLHWATEMRKISLIEFLLQNGANLTHKNLNGKTPFEYANEKYRENTPRPSLFDLNILTLLLIAEKVQMTPNFCLE